MTNDIHDIKGLVPLPQSYWWLWALLALVALAVVAWLWWRRRKPAAPPAIRTPVLTPFDLAVQAFRRLLEDQLIERGLPDEFYTRLSDIVRHYLEGRFHLRAPERTTEEFLYEVSRDHTLAQEHKDLLGRFLEECDLVKFARHRPASADMKRAFDAAEKFVNDTRPRLREPAPENTQFLIRSDQKSSQTEATK
jgi:hypothetical protein